MTLLNLIILAVVQGITEFLPISSSAHLVLLHEVGGPTGDDLALDVAVHLGTIAAVILYFHTDAMRALRGLGRLITGRLDGADSFLALALIIATIPAVIVGAILALTGWEEVLRNIKVIGWMMILFGVVLWWVHRTAPEARTAQSWTLRHALIMGLWQAVALIPGVSRSGISITAARGLGYTRHGAAQLSMLMSIPITLATGALLARDMAGSTLSPAFLTNAAIAAVLAFGAAYLTLALMMSLLNRVSFTPYVIYRIALGIVLLAIAYG